MRSRDVVEGQTGQAELGDALNLTEQDRTRMEAAHRTRALWMLVVMIALAILSQFFRSSNGVIAPELMHDLDISAEELGLTSSTFFIVFALLQIPIGVFFDRFGVRQVLPMMLVTAVIGSWVF